MPNRTANRSDRLQQWRTAARKELHPQALVPSLMVGGISSVAGLVTAFSFAALVFTGSWSDYLSIGVSIALFSSVVVRIGLSLFSSFSGVIADLDERAAVLLALLTFNLSQSLGNGSFTGLASTNDPAFLTLIAALGITSLITGLTLLALGWLRVGELIRFIPYPVLGGFIVGTGWLLVQGSLSVMTNLNVGWQTIPQLFQADVILQWLPGVAFGVLLLLWTRRSSSPWVLPSALIGGIAVFYIFLGLTQISPEEATDLGWFFQTRTSEDLWQPFQFSALSQIRWASIWQQSWGIGAIALMTSIGLLLNSAGIELATKQNISFDRELRVVGLTNCAVGLMGGMVGYQTLSDSVMAHRMGARSRAAGIISALLLLAIMQLNVSSVFGVVPKPILGGLLVLYGLEFLVEWLYDARTRLSRQDYGLVLLILAAIVLFGLLQGIGVGLAIAIILFVINYSRIPIARHMLSGATFSSKVVRSQSQTSLLQQEGDHIYILMLQGFLFFGTAHRLLQQVRQRLQSPDQLPLKFVVLDFRLVTGIDSSTVISFLKLKQLAQQHEFLVAFANLKPALQQQLRPPQGEELFDRDICWLFPDSDRALQWCEDQIIKQVPLRRRRFIPLELQLNSLFPETEQLNQFMNYLTELEVDPNDVLFRSGDPSDALFFIESGQVDIITEQSEGNERRRLKMIGAGSIVGEMDFCLQTDHTTAAIAQQPCILYKLSRTALETMEQDHPAIASRFQRYMNQLLAARLVSSYKEIQDLL